MVEHVPRTVFPLLNIGAGFGRNKGRNEPHSCTRTTISIVSVGEGRVAVVPTLMLEFHSSYRYCFRIRRIVRQTVHVSVFSNFIEVAAHILDY